jgi:hypothetical protein
MATVAGGLFHPASAAPTHVTATARPDAGPLSLAQVTRGSGAVGRGTSAVVGPQDDPRFAGQPAGAEQVVATQTQVSGGTMITLNDGSTIFFAGLIHPDAIIH